MHVCASLSQDLGNCFNDFIEKNFSISLTRSPSPVPTVCMFDFLMMLQRSCISCSFIFQVIFPSCE